MTKQTKPYLSDKIELLDKTGKYTCLKKVPIHSFAFEGEQKWHFVICSHVTVGLKGMYVLGTFSAPFSTKGVNFCEISFCSPTDWAPSEKGLLWKIRICSKGPMIFLSIEFPTDKGCKNISDKVVSIIHVSASTPLNTGLTEVLETFKPMHN